MAEDKKSKIIYYSKLIICLFGLFLILYMYIPILLFFITKLKWNLSGLIVRAGFISGLVFLLSYLYHIFSKKRLVWIILNVIAIRLLVSYLFYLINLYKKMWYLSPKTRSINQLFNIVYNIGFQAFPIISIIVLIISFALGMLAIYRLRWIAGISFTILIILFSSLIPGFMFPYIQKPIFGNIELDKDLNIIAKSSVLKEKYKHTQTINIDMLHGRGLFVFPERRKLVAYFGHIELDPVKKKNLILNLDYGISPVKYNIFKDKGSIKRAKLSRDGSKIYFANIQSGKFYIMDVKSGKVVQRYSIGIDENVYLLRYRERDSKRIPEYIRYSDEKRYLDYKYKEKIVEIIDFIVNEGNNELIVLYDHIPIIQKYRINFKKNKLEFLDDCCLHSGGAEFGTGCNRLFYDKKRDSYYVLTWNSSKIIFEIDAESLDIKRSTSLCNENFTVSFAYNPKNRSFLLSSYFKDILYEVSLDSLKVIDTHPLPNGIRRGYVDVDKDLFYFLDNIRGRFYIYDPLKKEIIHSYEIGRKPIALDVHPEINRAYFVSSYGIMELDLK